MTSKHKRTWTHSFARLDGVFRALKMLQLKVFYNLLSEGEKCEVIMVSEDTISCCDELMTVIRQNIESLCFIPDTELRVQYEDDEGTYVNLKEESFPDALRCAKPIATFRRLKLRLNWQPRSTPELVFAKRLETRSKNSEEFQSNETNSVVKGSSSSTTSTAAKKQLTYTSTTTDNKPPDSIDQKATSPARKQSGLSAATPTTAAENETLANTYKSPLDLLIQDQEKVLSQSIVERDILKQEYEIIATKFAKHVGVDYSKPACTSCHRREGHNRANCPFKGFPCKSAEFCGDLNKHKDEKDTVTLAWNRLQASNKALEKQMENLSSKRALKAQITQSFSQSLRTRLINECKERYINSLGGENWRQINMDLKKLEAHFKGKVPPISVNLIESLQDYEKKLQTTPQTARNPENSVRNLWELKGLKWSEAENH